MLHLIQTQSLLRFSLQLGLVVPSTSTGQGLHTRPMNEPWIVHCINMLLLLYSSPYNFVQGHHSLQCQPIQELHNTTASVKVSSTLPQGSNA